MHRSLPCLFAFLAFISSAMGAENWIEYKGQGGPGAGQSIVLVSGDEEYRSEEALPMLAKILSVRHGFDTRVLFAINPKTGDIQPTYNKNIPGLASLDEADLMIIFTRWRDLPADQLKHVDAFLKAGKPVIALRTGTHAFKPKDPDWVHYASNYHGPKKAWHGGFGRLVLGETWYTHHVGNGKHAMRGLLTPAAEKSPITKGIADGEIFAQTGVYGIRLPLPGDSQPLVLAQVLTGMAPDSKPLTGKKNDPMMPVAWTKSYQLPGGKPGRSFTTTMGSAVDLKNAALRKLIVNTVYVLLEMDENIPAAGTDVRLVDPYHPSESGFGEHKQGLRPADFALQTKETARENTKTGSQDAGVLSSVIKPGDHISSIGNTLAARMQSSGYLETLLQTKFPEAKLTLRNLSYPADSLTVRQRVAGFGTPDEWLTKTKADVVFAFFGFNESFGGKEGLPAFRKNLTDFITHTRSQKYNGQTPARLVLFSPIAAEQTDNELLPNAKSLNAQIHLYSEAMRQIAAAHDVPFVDLFAASRAAYQESENELTINGVHLTPQGYQLLIGQLSEDLFGATDPIDWKQLESLREAVQLKNQYWFLRYRTTDGYNVYGGRSYLDYTDGVTNRVVLQREMDILDAMATNLDHKIWSIASGGKVDPAPVKVPPFIPVKTNAPGKGPGGTHIYKGPVEEIKTLKIADGLKVNLFASEKKFPALVNPAQMAWSPSGKLFVGAWQTYPHWKPDANHLPYDKLLILDDTDGDGRADTSTVFADGLNNPTGFEFWNGGLLLSNAPKLLFLKDTDGDNVADVRAVLLNGLGSADTHHTANSFVIGPDGALYFQEGVFHRTQMETPYGPIHNKDACVWRFDPRSYELTRYSAHGYANPHGHVFDAWGNDVITDGTSARPYQGSLVSGFVPEGMDHRSAPTMYKKWTRPCPGIEILASRHFPDDYQGDLLVGNVIGFQGLLRYDLGYKGSALIGVEEEPLFSSSDPNFRPVDFEVGPDGALYFTDWQNAIIGHMQHHLRDPSRDHKHGRVYRVTYPGRPLLDEPNMSKLDIPQLLELLKSPEIRTRYRARIALSDFDSDKVAAAIEDWLGTLDKNSPKWTHQRLEALWVLQGHHAIEQIEPDLLGEILESPQPLARAAATRVLSTMLDEKSQSLALLRQMAADEDPRVRREAVRAASFVRRPEAVEVVVIARQKAVDPALEYLMAETLRSLNPIWEQALASNAKIEMTTEAGRAYLLGALSLDRLLAQKASPAVARELLTRSGVLDEDRNQAVSLLAQETNRSQADVLLEAVRAAVKDPEAGISVATDLVRLLSARPPQELAALRDDIESLALKATQPVIRQVAFAALVEIDGSGEAAWKLAGESLQARTDLLRAIPLISNPLLRSEQYDQIASLLNETQSSLKNVVIPRARYVRITLPRKGTLTLAEVQVISRGKNIAQLGKARQSATAHGGVASRAIDGNISGVWADGGQTHTPENGNHPWWELDLGAVYPIEAITIYNRTDDNFEERLKSFTLQLLDGQRKPVWTKKGNPPPRPKVTLALAGNNPVADLRRAAMNALVGLRGKETETTKLLAGFIAAGVQPDDTIAALRRIDPQFWPPKVVIPLLDGLVNDLRQMPPANRTSRAALARMELADAIAALLPVKKARTIRAQLRELGVRVIRVGTLPERMSYDKMILAAEAGKPVEIIFENPDLMPHNFVVVKPGQLKETGLLAEESGRKPGAAARDYVPRSESILLASKLLRSRQSQRMSFTVPQTPGVYPFVCTYPGHWRRMFGAFYVVEDIDAYLAAPEDYLAAHPLPIQDDLLKNRRPRKEWKLAELAPAVKTQMKGRSYARGRQMFKIANCIACHKLNEKGHEIGPDLAKLDPKRSDPMTILQSLMDPSKKIEEDFKSHVIVTDDGKVYTGMIVEETDAVVELLVNPLAKTEPMIIETAHIVARKPSPQSIMPKGLLDRLTEEEILDLIAYVAGGGKKDGDLFAEAGAMHHHHGH